MEMYAINYIKCVVLKRVYPIIFITFRQEKWIQVTHLCFEFPPHIRKSLVLHPEGLPETVLTDWLARLGLQVHCLLRERPCLSWPS